ncbi:hypothetical protein, partial [Sphingobium indicum]|uniref:hypothetical protein n=1 Tax=Sphingobium indicum TaxID=332055 RepID=UPI0018CB1778
VEAASSVFEGEPNLASNRIGSVRGAAAFAQAVKDWPASFKVAVGEKPKLLHETVIDNLSTAEFTVRVQGPLGSVDLPVAIIGERADSGLIKEARVYYFEKPITGQIGSRLSSFPRQASDRVGQAEDMPGINAEYFRAISKWDIEKTMAVFGRQAYVDIGVKHLDTPEKIRALYLAMFGIEFQLIFKTLAFDGKTMILEWELAGEHRESGLAAYQADEEGKIGGIRMYDVFDPDMVPALADA